MTVSLLHEIDKPFRSGNLGGLSFFIVLVVHAVDDPKDHLDRKPDERDYKGRKCNKRFKRYVHTHHLLR